MGTNKCASQAGMNAYGTRRHLYDPKSQIQAPMDNTTISLQMGTNKGASQVWQPLPTIAKLQAWKWALGRRLLAPPTAVNGIVSRPVGSYKLQSGAEPIQRDAPQKDQRVLNGIIGQWKFPSLPQAGMTAPGTRRAIYDQKLGTDKCDNSTMSLQMGFNQGANQCGQNFGLSRQIYDAKYCPKSGAVGEDQDGAGVASSYIQDYQDEGYQGYQEEEQVYQDDGTDY